MNLVITLLQLSFTDISFGFGDDSALRTSPELCVQHCQGADREESRALLYTILLVCALVQQQVGDEQGETGEPGDVRYDCYFQWSCYHAL